MHIFFSGIGGAGIGPLSLIAHQAGYTVSGSDKQDSQYISYLKKHGIEDIEIGQSEDNLRSIHEKLPIDWFVYSSAVEKENPNHPELEFVKQAGIKFSKRDEFLAEFIKNKELKLIAIAGTHGKSTTTAMMIWLLKELGVPVSYSVGAKLPFGDMGQYDETARYFVYECDEFDRNFLQFSPFLSIITGIAWDHHEIYPSFEEYKDAFREFVNNSDQAIVWEKDSHVFNNINVTIIDEAEAEEHGLELTGVVNRQNAWEVITAGQLLTDVKTDRGIEIMNQFPGLSRRMEELKPGLYSDYAHTPEKIKGSLQAARELIESSNKKLVVVYEPLTNRRAHYIKDQHTDALGEADVIYWVPSYLAREDKDQEVLSPAKLIEHLEEDVKAKAHPMEFNSALKDQIQKHLDKGDMVVCLSGGGGNSLDEWLRKEFK